MLPLFPPLRACPETQPFPLGEFWLRDDTCSRWAPPHCSEGAVQPMVLKRPGPHQHGNRQQMPAAAVPILAGSSLVHIGLIIRKDPPLPSVFKLGSPQRPELPEKAQGEPMFTWGSDNSRVDSSQFLCSILKPVGLWASSWTLSDLSYELWGAWAQRRVHSLCRNSILPTCIQTQQAPLPGVNGGGVRQTYTFPTVKMPLPPCRVILTSVGVHSPPPNSMSRQVGEMRCPQ